MLAGTVPTRAFSTPFTLLSKSPASHSKDFSECFSRSSYPGVNTDGQLFVKTAIFFRLFVWFRSLGCGPHLSRWWSPMTIYGGDFCDGGWQRKEASGLGRRASVLRSHCGCIGVSWRSARIRLLWFSAFGLFAMGRSVNICGSSTCTCTVVLSCVNVCVELWSCERSSSSENSTAW
jgi:hypothetical protein